MTESNALTVTFEVTLSGASRFADAAEVLQALRQVTDGLAQGRVDVVTCRLSPAATGESRSSHRTRGLLYKIEANLTATESCGPHALPTDTTRVAASS
jgi:hypothetical protein